MPLSAPAPRKPMHTRHIECSGYRREDGLWDIEAHLVDVKHYPISTRERGEIPPGEPLHDLWLRLTIDDELTVRAVESRTDHAPFLQSCAEVNPWYERLVGLRIGLGWTRAIGARVGGVQGCTHLTELLKVMATTAIQTAGYFHLTRPRSSGEAAMGRRLHPALANSCHSYDLGGETVRKHWPDQYVPAEATTAVDDDGASPA